MGQKAENIPVRIQYGHTPTTVVIQFSRPVTNLTSTPEQARSMIKELQNSLNRLEAAQAVLAKVATQHDREGRN